jgi:septum formation protein
MPAPRIILASSSIYRRELLARLGLEFEVQSPNIDETPLEGESPVATSLRLAKAKALIIAKQNPLAVVIGSDQVACLGEARLDKPGSAEQALAQLQMQRGKTCEFHTSVCVASQGGISLEAETVTTRVRFRQADELTDERLIRYIEIEKPLDCAGSAKSEGLGISLIEAIETSDTTALVGLPMIALCNLLRNVGVDPLASESSNPASPAP